MISFSAEKIILEIKGENAWQLALILCIVALIVVPRLAPKGSITRIMKRIMEYLK